MKFTRILGALWIGCWLTVSAHATLVDIKANGSDGPLRVVQGQEIKVSVRLEPDGALQGKNADWWLAASTGGVLFFHNGAGGWSASVLPVVQAPPMKLALTEVLTLPPLPEGSYTLYFGIDADADASPNPVALDAVSIEVLSAQRMPPRGGNLVQISALNAPQNARFTWLAASDERTSASQMRYQLHLGNSEDFTVGADTLKASVTGKTETELSDLPAGQTVYARIVAQDSDGNLSPDGVTLGYNIPSTPTVLAANTTLQSAQELGLGTASLSANTLSIAKSASTQSPAIGTILSTSDASGTPYLGKVTAVSEDAGTLRINMTPVPVSAVYASAAFSTSVRLDDLSSSAETSAAGLRSAQSAGVRLSAGANHAPARSQLRDIGVSTSVSLDTTLEFAPSLTYDFLWQGGGFGLTPSIDKAEIVLIGDFKAQTSFAFNFQAAGTYEREFDITIARLFPRTFQTRMFIGNVPVLVDVEMTLKGKVSASARSAIEATGIASYQRKLSLGLRYDPQRRAWVYTPYTEFARELTVALKAQGEVVGELRLIPNIEAKFNKVLAIGASIEPYLSATASIEAVAGANLLTGSTVAVTQPKVFDIALGTECKGYVNLDMLVASIPLLAGTVCGPYTYALFTLPQLELTTPQGTQARQGQALPLTFTSVDGTRDAVDARSLKFEVYPLDKKASIKIGVRTSPEAGKTVTALEFTACEAAQYTVYASAHGRLGEIARQYQVALIDASGVGVCTPVARIQLEPEVGPTPLRVNVDGTTSSVPQGNITDYRWTTSDGQSAQGASADFVFKDTGVHEVTLTVTAADGQSASATEYVTVGDCQYHGPITHFTQQVSLASILDRVYTRSCSASTGNLKLEQTNTFRPDGQSFEAYLKATRLDNGAFYGRDIQWGDVVAGSRLPTSRLFKESSIDLSASDWARAHSPAAVFASGRGFLTRAMRHDIYIGADWQLELLQTQAEGAAGSYYFSCNRNGDGKILTALGSGTVQLDSQCRATTSMVPIARPVADKTLWRNWQ